MKTSTSFATLALLLTTATATAHADSLGQKGQISIAGDFQISIVSESTDADNDESDLDIVISPALDFFIAPNLSVGGQVVFAREDQGELEAQTFGAGARVGYVIGLGKVSIWPRAGFTFARTSFEFGEADTTLTGLSLNVFAPVLYHPVDHFYLGLGPKLDYDVYADDDTDDAPKTTAIGIVSTIGGYF
jgi:hypothetical protein